MFVEGVFVQCSGVRNKELLLALAAGGGTAELRRLNPVRGVAMRANDVKWISHVRKLGSGRLITSNIPV